MSSCRTSITEVYQSGPATPPVANGWGCEVLTVSQQTKYVNGVQTDANGLVKATVQGIGTVVDTKFVTLVPLSNATTTATMSSSQSQTLYRSEERRVGKEWNARKQT